MNISTYLKIAAAFATIGVAGCTSDNGSGEPANDDSRRPIKIATKGDTDADTARDGGFVLIASDSDIPWAQLADMATYWDITLLNDGAGKWMSASPLYWDNETERYNAYVYSPTSWYLNDFLEIEGSIPSDQSDSDAYATADLTAGKSMDISSSDSGISVTMRHMMCRIDIEVVPGEGFKEGEQPSDEDLSISILDMRGRFVMSLRDMIPDSDGHAYETQEIKPHLTSALHYSAFVLPQNVDDRNFIRINWKGHDHYLKSTLTLEQGKTLQIKATLNRESGGIDIGIGGWDDSGDDWGGTVS